MRTRSLHILAITATIVLARAASAGDPPGSIVHIDDDAPPGGNGQSWATAYSSLQDAIAAIPNLSAPVTLRVAQGVYRPDIGAGITPGDREKSFEILYPIVLEGGYTGLTAADPDERDTALYTTLLCGDLLNDDGPDFTNRADNARTVVVASYPSGSIRIDGVTIRGGENPGLPNNLTAGGIVLAGGELTVSKSIITDNRGATGGGITFAVGASLTVECSWIHRNLATYCGGAIARQLNVGAGVCAIRSSRLTMNRARQGGALFLTGPGIQGAVFQIENSIFDRNTAISPNGLPFCGAMFASGHSSSFITNSIFYDNSAEAGQVGGVAILYNLPRVFNSIFVGNRDRLGVWHESHLYTASSFNPPNSVNLFDAYSATSGQFGGGTWHAIIADPMFVDPVGPDGIPGTEDDDFRLRAGSPAIDAGVVLPSVPSYPVPPATDLDGRPRIIDDPTRPDSPLVPASTAPIDLGPYEYQSDCNSNTIIDSLDIANDPSIDCDNDGIIDACQPYADCNGNALNDRCEIAAGTAPDCNGNGIPDACDIALGTSLDENDNGIPDECEPAVVRVAAPGSLLGKPGAWDDALEDLQEALAIGRSRPGPTEVWVADGVYHPSGIEGTFTDTFEIPDGVTLMGGFAGNETSADQRDPTQHSTILSGDRASNDVPLVGVPGLTRPSDRMDNVLNVVRIPTTHRGVKLDGLTIFGGFADGPGPTSSSGPVFFTPTSGGSNIRGGGLLLGHNAVPQIAACRFVGNFALGGGAAAGGGIFERCVFEGNQAAANGGAVNADRSIRLTDSLFIGNSTLGPDGLGGAVALLAGIEPGRELLVSRCRFIDNRSLPGGGAVFALALNSTTIENSFFSGNSARNGAAVWYAAPSGVNDPAERGMRIINSTIVKNTAITQTGGAVRGLSADNSTVANNILWGNTFGDGDSDFVGQWRGAIGPWFAHNCIQGYESGGGPGNIGLDPRFLDLNGPDGIPGTVDDNPSLAARSPCIDAGDNDAMPAASTTDLLGSPRFIDDPNTIDTGTGTAPIVDIGAAEYVPPYITCAGDANGDNLVNAADLSVFLFMFGLSVTPGAAADFNADGIVDAADLSILLARFGMGC